MKKDHIWCRCRCRGGTVVGVVAAERHVSEEVVEEEVLVGEDVVLVRVRDKKRWSVIA
jgi:hypothetical protein